MEYLPFDPLQLVPTKPTPPSKFPPPIAPDALQLPIPATPSGPQTPKRSAPKTSSPLPYSKRSRQAVLPPELGKCVSDDVSLLKALGWAKFVRAKRGVGDIGDLGFEHPAKRLLHHYKNRGAPAKMKQKDWSPSKLCRAMARGPHKLCYEFLEFLQK